MSSLDTIALIGANGQIGNAILHALIECPEKKFTIIAFIRPGAELRHRPGTDVGEVKLCRVDLSTCTKYDLVPLLEGVDAVISALGGSLIPRQRVLQDAAEFAHVRRFYPSEFGMHSLLRLPGKPVAIVHPCWDVKMKALEDVMRHPAIRKGYMSYTVIGCSENYDVPLEPFFNPWLDTETEEYVIHAVGYPDAKMDYTSVHDVAAFLVASLCQPHYSENAMLSFRSDYISHAEIAKLLRKYSGKKVTLRVTSFTEAAWIIENPESAPAHLLGGSTFPVDFCMALRYVQGQGRLWRVPGQLHNHYFPQIRTQDFETYFSRLFNKSGVEERVIWDTSATSVTE